MSKETFTVTDGVYKDGILVPGTDLLSAVITINTAATGADNPDLENLLERMVKTASAIATMYGTSVYTDFLERLDSLIEYAREVVNASYGVESDREGGLEDMIEQLNLFDDTPQPETPPEDLN
jgi:hypothetical protein